MWLTHTDTLSPPLSFVVIECDWNVRGREWPRLWRAHIACYASTSLIALTARTANNVCLIIARI